MAYTAAVITVSDKGARGERVDTSGPALCEMLKENGYSIEYTSIIPDEISDIQAEIKKCADEKMINLILTTGGTGFAKRDVTPEATREILDRETPGIAEAMRRASMQITVRGCLSRGISGIRNESLIINLPGSKKGSTENLESVLGALGHAIDMIRTTGSRDCAVPEKPAKKKSPSVDAWLKEAKHSENADKIGMFLTHNGAVRATAKAKVRNGEENTKPVKGMYFSYDSDKVDKVIADTYNLDGIYYVKVWLNEGELETGDDIMYVLIGGDIRPHVTRALDFLVGKIKSECVTETEKF